MTLLNRNKSSQRNWRVVVIFVCSAALSFARGAKLEAWAATSQRVPGAADILACGRDSVLLAGLDSKDCNGPGCKFGGDRDQGTIDQLRNEERRSQYDAATVAEALDACGALAYLRSDRNLSCSNTAFSYDYGKMIQAILAPRFWSMADSHYFL